MKAPRLGWFPTIVLILEHNIKVFVVVFLVFGRKNDAENLVTVQNNTIIPTRSTAPYIFF